MSNDALERALNALENQRLSDAKVAAKRASRKHTAVTQHRKPRQA